MAGTINSNCHNVLDGAWQVNRHEGGAFEWLGRLADRFLYPEIRSDDNRIAEYIPPEIEIGAEW